jgi:hypothetical protein
MIEGSPAAAVVIDPRRLVPPAEAGRRIGRSPQRVVQLFDAGKLGGVRIAGVGRLIDVGTLDRYLAERGRQGGGDAPRLGERRGDAPQLRPHLEPGGRDPLHAHPARHRLHGPGRRLGHRRQGPLLPDADGAVARPADEADRYPLGLQVAARWTWLEGRADPAAVQQGGRAVASA